MEQQGGHLLRQWVLVAVLLAAGCIESGTVQCFGSLCPPGTQCVTALEQCAPVEQIEACTGLELEDGSTCRFADKLGVCQSGVCAAGCGDELRLDEEVCDGIDVGGASCEDFGFYTGALSCNDTCDSLETDSCLGFCGDAEINGPEFCDPGVDTEPDCTFLGFDRGRAACEMDCQ